MYLLDNSQCLERCCLPPYYFALLLNNAHLPSAFCIINSGSIVFSRSSKSFSTLFLVLAFQIKRFQPTSQAQAQFIMKLRDDAIFFPLYFQMKYIIWSRSAAAAKHWYSLWRGMAWRRWTSLIRQTNHNNTLSSPKMGDVYALQCVKFSLAMGLLYRCVVLSPWVSYLNGQINDWIML